MSESAVVDAHVHFWDVDRLRYPWLDAVPDLCRTFRPEDLRTGCVPVKALVFVEADREPSQTIDEVAWASGLSAPSRPPIAGVVAAAALESPQADAELDVLAGHASVKGVRRLLQDCRPGFGLEPAFVRSIQSLARRGLVFDACVRDHQLSELTALAERCPEVTFVLDHLGKPRIRPTPDRSWLVDIERLAALPNVRCKLSGLTSEVLDPIESGGTGELFGPYLRHAVQQFGPSRCLFGSDWPVASLTVTYEGWFDHVTSALTDLSGAEFQQVMGGTAIQVYGLEGGEDAWH
jgi:L-fuconolactonase